MTKFLTLIFLLFSISSFAAIDRKAFYAAMSGDDATAIASVKKQLNAAAESADKRAMLGALLMKESQFEKTSKLKLEKFNQGKVALEAEIKKQSSNTEFRFLRLLIQENAPKILKYNSSISSDASHIVSNLSKTSSTLKTTIMEYAKSSKSLQEAGYKLI
jgi:hypothetical protein